MEKGYEASSFLNMYDYSLCFVVVFGASCVHAPMAITKVVCSKPWFHISSANSVIDHHFENGD